MHLGRWGARSLGEPRPDALIMAMRTTFHTDAARGLTTGYELHLGEIILHIRIDNGDLQVGPGPSRTPTSSSRPARRSER
jgi:hypothetical protein